MRPLRPEIGYTCRSPSWGAWIEILLGLSQGAISKVAPPRGERGLKYIAQAPRHDGWGRSPSWGAWIEIPLRASALPPFRVAPPRGERGLKCFNGD